MHPQASSPLDYVQGVAFTIAAIVTATIVIAKLSKSSSLNVIPTVGSSSWLGSWWAGHKFQKNGVEIIQEGYEKYKSAPFKVADRYRWIVVLSDHQHMEELRKASDDALSFLDAANDLMQIKYTMGPEIIHNPYHNEIILSRLTPSLSNIYSEIRDEISVAFDEVLDLKDTEWKSVHILVAIRKIVCRTSNRLFVGLPLCRDPGWIDINLRFAVDAMNRADKIRRFPSFLAPIVAYFVTDVQETMKCATGHLAPEIEERMKLQKEYGNDWVGKPNDLLSWLLEKAPEGPERTSRALTLRVLSINFAAIHTTSNSLYQALFFLAENPQYIQPLREEVESIVEREGWSKASVGKMRKIDSFLRESQRLTGTGIVNLTRKALKDFTFSDGTFIPKGTTVVAPSRCLHLDETHYDNAHMFNPFRFSDMREKQGEGTKHQFVTTSIEYLSFGHGKHACPGRFFAANELKSMLGHVVISYDIELEGKKRPSGLRDGLLVRPDPTARIKFRRRFH